MTGRLDGKVAVITGSGGGQGRSAALLFATEGAQVVGCDVNTEGAAETVGLVQEAGGRMSSAHPLDLTDEEAVARWMGEIGEVHGRIDILYNNAGATRFGPVESITAAD